MLDDEHTNSGLSKDWPAERKLNVVLVNEVEDVTSDSYGGVSGTKISFRHVRFGLGSETDPSPFNVRRATEWLRHHLLKGEDCVTSKVEELEVPVLISKWNEEDGGQGNYSD